MTTRPLLGSHRPPQSSLSGTVQAGQNRIKEERVDLLPTGGDSPYSLAKNARPKLTQSRSASAAGSPNAAQAIVKQPRGKPTLHFDIDHVKAENTNSADSESPENVSTESLPLPVRPGRRERPTVSKQRVQPTSTARKDARPKPYTLEVPTMAPQYPPNGHADYFPWTGNHPEDKLNDNVIRNGYFDKSASQNETGSAKTSIYPALKQKAGLQTLSSLFVAVLDQRRTHGQISSASTFKPPPRVTLTDTKRETWLRDLANPSISLRRLSRTIPHGIRGKVLLEQCLSKNIPTERAVWLTKCVGANEIRASKRKGVSGTFALGGEAKWIRDWTGFVENFVESIINLSEDRDWKAKIGYVFRFAANLHSEHLLDRDHYLDWLSSSLENCSLARLPIWLLNTQIYWNELLQYRKHGRRVATALLSHLHSAHTDPDKDILSPIIERLVGLIDDLVIKRSENFVSPTTWAKYGLTLQAYMDEGPLRSNVFRALDLRNSRLSIAPKAEKELSPRAQLIQLLDNSNMGSYSKSLARQGWELSQDRDMLVRTLLEWVSSSHRSGVTKVYIGARVLRGWSEFGIDVTAEMLAFLDADCCEFRRCKQSLYHLVCELTRSEHFLPARYIQWLIAGGRLREAADVERYGPCATRLLAEIPTHKMNSSIETLRRTLLARVGFSVEEEEEEAIQLAMATIDQQSELQNLPMREGQPADGSGTDDYFSSLADLSWAVRSEIGLWLRKRVGMHKTLRMPNTKDWRLEAPPNQLSAVTLAEYQTLSLILEGIEDFSIYADILKFITTSDEPEVLAAITDTLNMHLEKFACIGALDDLFDKLHVRLRMLDLDHTKFTRKFLLSLSDLAARVPDRQDIEKQLAQEVIQSGRNGAVDACSPVSDHMVDVLQNAEVDFADEIEKVLESGNTMDHATHDRLFQTIICRLEACGFEFPEQQRSCCELLIRLRSFDSEHFDFLMSSWLSRLLNQSRTLGFTQYLPPLISNGCVSLKMVLDSCDAYLGGNEAKENMHTSIGVAHDSLVLLLGMAQTPEMMDATDIQRYRIYARNMQKDHPKQALSTIKHAVEWIMPLPDESRSIDDAMFIRDQFRSNCSDRKMMDLLRNLIVTDVDTVKSQLLLPLIQRSNDEINGWLQLLLDHLLLPNTSTQEITLDSKSRVEKTLKITDDLTSPFCQLQLVFQMTSTGREEDQQILHLTLAEAIEDAVAMNSMAWTSILPSLDSPTASHLCEQAESLLISLIPTTKAKGSPGPSESIHSQVTDITQARNFLKIVEATSFAASKTPRSPQFPAQIVDKLSDIWNSIISTSDPDTAESDVAASTGGQNLDSDNQEVESGLLLLLRLITLHAQSSPSIGSSSTPASSLTPGQEQNRTGNMLDKSIAETRAKLLLHLISLLHIFQIRQNAKMVLVLFDVAIVLVDEYISEEARLICIKAVKDRTSDERIRYLLGYTEDEMEWLYLCQKAGGGFSSGKCGEKMGEMLKTYDLRPWEMLSEPTPNVGENDTSLSLVLFGARR